MNSDQFQKNSMNIETPVASLAGAKILNDEGRVVDDDERVERTGTWVTASARIVTAAIGSSGVLSVAWAFAQVGWVGGPAVLFAFSFIIYFTSTLVADCYRSPDPVHGKRNYSYFEVARSVLGGRKFQLFQLAVYANLISVTVYYTITTSISMGEVRYCFHKHEHDAKCISNKTSIIIFACIQIVLSQIPNFHKPSWRSIVKAVMSFAYSFIGLGLCIAIVAGGGALRRSVVDSEIFFDGEPVQTSLTGVKATGAEKVWLTFQAIGNVAYAYAEPDSIKLIEIQDTLKSSPPENKVMKRASLIGISTTTLIYMLCGTLGYAAFGNETPGNFLAGYKPFWLIDLANVCVAVHLIWEYQVVCQPLFQFVERKNKEKWPNSQFVTGERTIHIPLCGTYTVKFFRVVWRTTYVIITALIAMIFPFFNDFIGLIGSLSFWPLTVYFPIEVYIKHSKMHRFSFKWTLLMILSWACLIVSIISAAGSIQGIVQELKKCPPFKKGRSQNETCDEGA